MPNVWKPQKYYQYHVQFNAQHVFIKYVSTVPSDCIIFFQEFCEVSALFKYVQSTKTEVFH